MMNQNDTIKLKSWNLKEVDGAHWADHHVVYGVNDTIIISMRKPLGLIGIPETCRYTPVWVSRSEILTIPGRMKFGEDTLQPGLEKTELPLDGVWMEIPASKPLLTVQPVETTTSTQFPPPSKLRSFKEIPAPVKYVDSEPWNIGMNSFMFTFLLVATSLYAVSSASHWQCYLTELFSPILKRRKI
jgi:hypothetical protein